MGCYRHLTRDDREEIAALRTAGHSMRAVAAASRFSGGTPAHSAAGAGNISLIITAPSGMLEAWVGAPVALCAGNPPSKSSGSMKVP